MYRGDQTCCYHYQREDRAHWQGWLNVGLKWSSEQCRCGRQARQPYRVCRAGYMQHLDHAEQRPSCGNHHGQSRREDQRSWLRWMSEVQRWLNRVCWNLDQ